MPCSSTYPSTACQNGLIAAASIASIPISSTWTDRRPKPPPACVVSLNSSATAEIRRASSTSSGVTQATAGVCRAKITRSERTSIRRCPSAPGSAAARAATSAASGSDPVRTSVLNSPSTYRHPSPVTASDASPRLSFRYCPSSMRRQPECRCSQASVRSLNPSTSS